MFKILVKLLGKLSRIHIEAQSLPNSMVSRALYMHSQLAQANENALVSKKQVQLMCCVLDWTFYLFGSNKYSSVFTGICRHFFVGTKKFEI